MIRLFCRVVRERDDHACENKQPLFHSYFVHSSKISFEDFLNACNQLAGDIPGVSSVLQSETGLRGVHDRYNAVIRSLPIDTIKECLVDKDHVRFWVRTTDRNTRQRHSKQSQMTKSNQHLIQLVFTAAEGAVSESPRLFFVVIFQKKSEIGPEPQFLLNTFLNYLLTIGIHLRAFQPFSSFSLFCYCNYGSTHRDFPKQPVFNSYTCKNGH